MPQPRSRSSNSSCRWRPASIPAIPETAAAEIRAELGDYFDLIAENLATNTSLRERYAAETEGGVPCVSHILVGPEDEELANDLLAQLEDGADFPALAEQNSIDPGSAVAGGDLGCAGPPAVRARVPRCCDRRRGR
ncbi:MAG: peptidylprolyl isomerase [Acidimicrobiales bacterium]